MPLWSPKSGWDGHDGFIYLNGKSHYNDKMSDADMLSHLIPALSFKHRIKCKRLFIMYLKRHSVGAALLCKRALVTVGAGSRCSSGSALQTGAEESRPVACQLFSTGSLQRSVQF